MRRTALLSACAFATLAWCFTGTAFAQRLDGPATRDVYFTFSQPVVVPSRTLPPGKYLFRVVGDGRTIVRIFAGDGSKLIHTAMSVHAMRSDQPERPEIRLIESAADTPVAIGTWWYPEMRQGWEFVYPREQAMKMAKTAKQPILTTARAVPENEMSSGELVRIDPSGQQAPYAANSQPAPLVGTAQVGEVAASDAAANRVASAMTSQEGQAPGGRTALPRTASATPLVALAGMIAFVAAFAVRFWRRAA
jgi:hypothetical protein